MNSKKSAGGDPSGKHQPDRPAPHSDQHKWHPEESQHRQAERSYWRVQNRIAPATLAISLIALVASVGSAILASLALQASQQAADANIRQANTASDTEKRQLRAYVSPDLVLKTGNTIRGGDGTHKLAMRLSILNHGQTPARNVRLSGIIRMLPLPLRQEDIIDLRAIRLPQTPTLFPGIDDPPDGWIQADRIFTFNEFNVITTPDSGFVAVGYGTVTYDDVFDNSHRTEFCYYMDPLSVVRVNGNITNVRWAVCDRHTNFD